MTTPSSTQALVTPEELDDMESLARRTSGAAGDRWERLCKEVRRLRAEIKRFECPFAGLIGPLEHKLNGCCS